MKEDNNTEKMFADLIVDKATPPNLKLCKEIIEPYLKIDKEGGIEPNDKFQNLTGDRKLGVYLVARKVMYILRYLSSEKISENEIVKIIGIPLGSVRGYCGSSLKKFIKNEEGYFLLNYKLKGFKDYLEAKKK